MTGTVMEFQVCRHGNDGRWVVRLGSAEYGSYLGKEEAVLDAIEAAKDERLAGHEVEVWLREGGNASQIL